MADRDLFGPANLAYAQVAVPSPAPPAQAAHASKPPRPGCLNPPSLRSCRGPRAPLPLDAAPAVDHTCGLALVAAEAGDAVLDPRAAARVRAARRELAAAAPEDARRARREADEMYGLVAGEADEAGRAEGVPGFVRLGHRSALQLAELDAVWHGQLTRSGGKARRDRYGAVVLGSGMAADAAADAWGAVELLLFRRRASGRGTRVAVYDLDRAAPGAWAPPPEAALAGMHVVAGMLARQGCVDVYSAPAGRVGQFARDAAERLEEAEGARLVVGLAGLSAAQMLRQVAVALQVLRPGGYLVLRTGPADSRLSVGLLYVLHRVFRRVHAARAEVCSEYGAAEGYLVCTELAHRRPAVQARLLPMVMAADRYARDEDAGDDASDEDEASARAFCRAALENAEFRAFCRAFNTDVLLYAEARLARAASVLAGLPYLVSPARRAAAARRLAGWGLGTGK